MLSAVVRDLEQRIVRDLEERLRVRASPTGVDEQGRRYLGCAQAGGHGAVVAVGPATPAGIEGQRDGRCTGQVAADPGHRLAPLAGHLTLRRILVRLGWSYVLRSVVRGSVRRSIGVG